jgi:hypothetical protein
VINVFDTRHIDRAPKSFPGPAGVGSSQGGDQSAGLVYSARDGLLYAYHESGGPHVSAIDPDSGLTLWSVSLFPRCRPSQAGFTQWRQQALGQSSDGRFLFTLCRIGTSARSAIPGPAPVGVVRVSLPEDRRDTLTSYRIDVYPGITPGSRIADALWVPDADRLIAVVGTNQGTGWAAYVFDGPTTSFIGAPALFQPSGSAVQYLETPTLGVDPVSGRVFVHAYAQAFTGRRDQGAPCSVLGRNEFAVIEAGRQSLGNAAIRYPSHDPHLFGDDRGTAFDPLRRSLWMIDRPARQGSCSIEHPVIGGYSLAVYRDAQPLPQPRAVPDPDQATADIPEAPGRTGANFGAQASAFGVRYQLAPSGTEGPLTNYDVPSAGALSCDPKTSYAPGWSSSGLAGVFNADTPDPPPLPAQYKAFCHAGNREATFARLPGVSLDAQEAAADAVAGDTDRASAEDLVTASDATHPGFYVNNVVGFADAVARGAGAPAPLPPPCEVRSDPSAPRGVSDSCSPTRGTPAEPYASGQALPFEPAACRDSGGEASERSGQIRPRVGQADPAGSTGPAHAEVRCSLESSLASGSAYTNSPSVGIPIFAHEAAASATVSRTASQGSIAAADVTVDGIDVAGLLRIARLEVHARVRAYGRPGTNRVEYLCTVSGVRIAQPGGGALSLPAETACADPQLRDGIDQLNGAMQGVLSIELPQAPTSQQVGDRDDADLLVVQRASPRGYLAEVSASRIRQLQNAVLLSDPSIEQPALVVTVYGDSQSQRDRLVVTFSGVAVRGTYGIFALSRRCPECGSIGELPSVPPTPSTLGAAFTPPSPPPAEPPAQTPRVVAIGQRSRGLRFLLHGPGAIASLLAVWALLLWPGVALARRRALDAAIREVSRR